MIRHVECLEGKWCLLVVVCVWVCEDWYACFVRRDILKKGRGKEN